ncbi:MAG: TonB-dependent receptor [Prevotellaceae bacterium]|jgi:TonB-linked SusC/RagA family outer membrane protein|nr:TonB-dependent receptor [Prevotellaceae bacterium]
MLICCSWSKVHAQQRQITGVVNDADKPMPGVSVVVQGSSIGVVTDVDGRYSISAASSNALEFSFLGYVTQVVPVGDRSVINVNMSTDEKGLEEIVVIGYGSVKKRDLTGAVTSIKAEDVTISPTGDVMEALQGKIAGVDIMRTSGELGSGVNITMRGTRSIYGNNTPLFIIDGVPGEYSSINPTDIESIDVLKDASSTAIYGSAGANGVIIITTRRGNQGKTTVNFNAYYGFNGTPDFYEPMLGDEWTKYQYEAYKFVNGSYPANISSILTQTEQQNAYNEGKWIDWLKEVAGNRATSQKYDLSISGGNEKTKFFSSAAYEHGTGLLKTENMDKYSLRLNIDHTIFPWASVGFTSNFRYTIRDRGISNAFTKATSAFPLGDAYDDEGNIKYEYMPNFYSPLGDYIPDQYVNNTRAIYSNSIGYLEIRPLAGLTFRSQVNGRVTNERQGRYWGAKTTANRPSYAGTPHAEIVHRYDYRYTWENILSYAKEIGSHSFGATLVSSWNNNVDEDNTAGASGQEVDRWSFYRLLAGNSKYVDTNIHKYQKMSYAARANYSYKGKYLLNVSSRWDGVSWFSEGHKWDVFPAAAVAWRISDEEFMSDTKSWLSNLKLRVSYGVTGNSYGTGTKEAGVTDLLAYSTETQMYYYTSNGVTVNGQNASFVQSTGTYGNKSLGWEKSYNANVGIDASILKNRIDLTLDWFQTQTKDLLYRHTAPVTDGLTGWGSPLSIWENLAETANTGWEISVNSRNIRTSRFTWSTSLSFTWSNEKIVSLPTPEGKLEAESLFEGYPIKSIFSYKYEGIWGTDTPQATLDAYNVKPGYVKIQTIPKDNDEGAHAYSTSDRMILGHSNPDYIVGLNNTLTYHDFDLSVFVMGRFGQTISSSFITRYTAPLAGANEINQLSGVDYWTETNQGAYYPAPGSGNQQSIAMAALSYRDGSFIKLKNVTLGYTLPRNISQHAKMEKLRIYATAYNPLVWAKDEMLKGTDPESNSESFPLYRQYVFGVNITF